MERYVERVFDASRPTICMKPFRANGHSYTPGDTFPWRRIAVTARRARQLFEARYITHPGLIEVEPQPTPEPQPTSEPQAEAPTIAQEVQDEDIQTAPSIAALKEAAQGDGRQPSVRDARRKLSELNETW
jgi:hypothetical protein